MNAKFCNTCGEQLVVKRELSTFNTETGKKNFEMHCPTGKCGHYGNNCEYRLITTSWWKSDFYVCIKCGAETFPEVRI